MALSKRDFLKLSGLSATAVVAGACSAGGKAPGGGGAETELQSIVGDAAPITVAERQGRIARAQELMAEAKLDAVLIEPGSAMMYFSGLRWRRSERLTALVIPRQGPMAVVTPFFEEPKVREGLTFGDDVRTWHEHEDPFALVAGVVKDNGPKHNRIGLEETVRFFAAEGLRRAAPQLEVADALPVTLGCRLYKSPTELALMTRASEITLRAYEHVYTHLEAGMVPGDVRSLMRNAQTALGGQGVWGMALFGTASAYPHGTNAPQEIKKGQIVLMDCGCSVHGYKSDISRTFVFGEPTNRQREVWNTVRKGQQIAFDTAKLGTPAGAVDDAVRSHYESLGYGPGYATPGLSHRTGHGIGMDGHERVNFVHGETTPLAPGMCFSNEPGIYIYGEFGVRLEDCIYMTESGPAWFSVPPDSLDEPIGRMA